MLYVFHCIVDFPSSTILLGDTFWILHDSLSSDSRYASEQRLWLQVIKLCAAIVSCLEECVLREPCQQSSLNLSFHR